MRQQQFQAIITALRLIENTFNELM